MRNNASCQENAACDNMGGMEIAYLGKETLRIKGKQGSLVVDPPSRGEAGPTVSSKTEADAVLFSTKNSDQSATVSGSRLTIVGPGEYEVAGIKVSSVASDTSLVYTVKVDNVAVIVGEAAAISKLHDKLSEPHIVAAKVNEGTLAEAITALAPRVVVLYGEKANAEAKNLGKEDIKAVNKYVTALEKLPADLEVVILG